MLESIARSVNPGSSSRDGQSKVWKKIWKIKTPNWIRHFIWRATRDSLPTTQNLRYRHVPVEASCPTCDEHSESLIHCLWLCEHAQVMWKSNGNFVRFYKKQYRSFLDLLEEVLDNASGFQVALFSTISWCLWQRRNRVRENQPTWPLLEVGERAVSLVQKFLDLSKLGALSRSSSAQVGWSRPPIFVFKVNFDATLFENIGSVGIGVAIRDSDGEIIAALSQRILLPFSVEMAKAMAARRALLFAQGLSLYKVMMEGDCFKVVSALNSSVSYNMMYGNVVEETRRQVCKFHFSSFSHMHRGGNKLAHALARRAVSSVGLDVWVEELPFELESVFPTDYLNL